MLQPGDILKHCKVSLGMNFVTEEMILRPTAEGVHSMYACFLQIAFNRRERPGSYPDYHEVSAPIVLVFNSLRQLFTKLGCREPYLVYDHLCPDTKRTRKFLSALINFVKFKTDEEVFGEHLLREQAVGVSAEEFAKVREEWTAVQGDIEKIKSKIESQQDSVSEKRACLERLHNSKANIEKARTQVLAAVEALEGQIESDTSLLESVMKTITERQDMLKFVQNSVTNPDAIIKELKLSSDRLEAERAQHLDIDQRLRSLESSMHKCTESALKIKNAKTVLELLQFSKSQKNEVKGKMKARAEALMEAKREIEIAGMKLAAVQRDLAAGNQQTVRKKETAEGRLQSLHTQFKVKTEELSSLKQRSHEGSQVIQRMQTKHCEIENRFRREEEAFVLRKNRATQYLESLNKAADVYYQWLLSVSAKL